MSLTLSGVIFMCHINHKAAKLAVQPVSHRLSPIVLNTPTTFRDIICIPHIVLAGNQTVLVL